MQAAFVLGGAEFDTGFARGVVEDELVVAALPGLAGRELLALDAGETGLMGVSAVFLAGEEGRGIGAGLLGAAGDPVARGVGIAAAVVGGTDDDGTVDVAVLEGDEDFLPGAGDEMAAPVGTGDWGHDAQPDAETGIGRSIVAPSRVVVPGTGIGTSLPGKLDADATVAVGVGGVAPPDEDGGEGAAGGGAGMDMPSVTVSHQRLPGDAGADGGEGVAVVVDLGTALLCRALGVPDRLERGTGFMGDGGDQEVALFRIVPVVFGVVGEREGGSGGRAAHGALAVELFQPGIDGLTLVEQHAFAVGIVLPGVLAGVVPGGGLEGRAAVDCAEGALRSGGEAAVIPAGGVGFRGVELAQAVPAIQGIFGERGAGLGETDARLRVRGKGAVGIGDDQGVAAQGFAHVGAVFEPAEQAFFGEQALEEGEIAFAILHGHAALGVGSRVGELPAPGGNELSLLFPVGKELVDDVDDALVLEEVVVPGVAEEGKPGFDDQAVAGEATVRAVAGDARDVAVESSGQRARGGGLQVEAGGLAEQGGQREVGVGRQGRQFDAVAGVFAHRAEGFVDANGFGQQCIGTGRGAQGQQPVGLLPAGAAGEESEGRIHGLVCLWRETRWLKPVWLILNM